MQCGNHSSQLLSLKCIECNKYICQECQPYHCKLNHSFLTSAQISEGIRDQIASRIKKITDRIYHLSSLLDFQQGIQIIELCHAEIMNYLNQIFQNLKKDYKAMVNNLWKNQNHQKIFRMETQIDFLTSWDRVILKNPLKAIVFDLEALLTKQQQQEGLNFTLNQPAKDFAVPQIAYNQMALRRVSESLTQAIGLTRINGKKIKKQKNARIMSKFLEGTNIMYEFEVQTKTFKKYVFRQFVVPLRSQSICIGNEVYLVGGQSKKGQASKQVWIYQRNYNIMRIIAMMKQGRVGHCVCTSSNCVLSQQDYFSSNPDEFYVFGGKGVSTLEKVNVKTKALQFVSDFGRSIVGASGTQCNNCLYFFGGTFEPFQLNEFVIRFDIQKQKWDEILVANPMFYTRCLNQITTRISHSQIAIFGGYKPFQQSGLCNMGMQVYNIKSNYLSVIGNYQTPGLITENGGNVDFIGGHIVTLCNFKRCSKSHGPNLPMVMTYGLKQNKTEVDFMLPM